PVERQFVDITHGEYVAPIECTLAAFVGETVAVLWRAEIRLRGRNCMRVRIVGANLRIPAEAFLKADLQGMIIGIKTRGENVDRVIALKRANRVQLRCSGACGNWSRYSR